MALDIAVGNGALYWTDQGHGTVKALSAACGQTTISSTETRPGFVTVSGSSLFWIDIVSAQTGVNTSSQFPTTTATLRKASLLGGRPTNLVTETNLNGGITGLVASEDGKTLYYSADTNVKMIPVAGGTPVIVGHEETEGVPGALAIAGSTIAYATYIYGDVDVIFVMAGMTAICNSNFDSLPGQVADFNCVNPFRSTAQSSPFTRPILRESNVYYNNDSSIEVNAATPGALKYSGSQVTSGQTDQVTTLVGGPRFIYFGEDGFVEKTPYVVGSTAIVIARGQPAPNSMAVDATRVYWSTGDCAINATGL